ncbi:MAG: LD-carboxypeptidase [Saprospiraceae bacterium]|nr:LD-carboxypeptidase [Saprospiraceae bacterium]
MQRRFFFKTTGMAALAGGVPALRFMEKTDPLQTTKLHKPPRLRAGMTIGLIAPASPFSEEKRQAAQQNLSALGFQIKESPHLYAQNGYLAGSDAQRLEDLHWAFSDPAIDAVWCIRGGYGCSRLLPHIDFDLIGRHPKVLIGYSDITALHLAIQQRSGLVTFHGPVAASEFPENTLRHFRSVLMEPVTPYTVQIPKAAELPEDDAYQPFVVTPGQATGKLIGGNLTLLAALVGTPFAPSYKNKIVFIEDVGEQPYRIDRMLTQMLQGSDLSKAAGIALGVFADCKPKGDSLSLTLQETLRDRFANLGIPVVYGIPFGHVAHQMTFPYGIQAALDATLGQLTLLETGVL